MSKSSIFHFTFFSHFPKTFTRTDLDFCFELMFISYLYSNGGTETAREGIAQYFSAPERYIISMINKQSTRPLLFGR